MEMVISEFSLKPSLVSSTLTPPDISLQLQASSLDTGSVTLLPHQTGEETGLTHIGPTSSATETSLKQETILCKFLPY